MRYPGLHPSINSQQTTLRQQNRHLEHRRSHLLTSLRHNSLLDPQDRRPGQNSTLGLMIDPTGGLLLTRDSRILTCEIIYGGVSEQKPPEKIFNSPIDITLISAKNIKIQMHGSMTPTQPHFMMCIVLLQKMLLHYHQYFDKPIYLYNIDGSIVDYNIKQDNK